jgi:selenide,water dikinase
VKRLLLAGAGHAHLALLAGLAEKPLPAVSLTLVSPRPRQIYSGMLPGVIAGHYRREEAEIDVAALARRAGAQFVEAEVTGLDPTRRSLGLADGRRLDFDLASLNVGSRIARSVPGSAEHALPVKPFDAFLDRLPRTGRIAIAGGGAGGAEIAMALRHAGMQVTVYSDQTSFSPSVQERLVRAMRSRGVDFRPGMRVDAIEAGPLVISGTTQQEFDVVLWATGAAALPWLKETGLATDDQGFVRVDPVCRSVSHSDIFALGDCAAMAEARSGVHAVRQGRALERNLRRLLSGQIVFSYRKEPKALMLLSCGARYAVAARGGWSAEGRWAWWWKNWIDRRWLRKLRAT